MTFYRTINYDMAAKRHKPHKNNYLHIGISNSYGREKYKFGLFTNPSKLKNQKKPQGVGHRGRIVISEQ